MYDVVVVGAGAGGLGAARRARERGLTVLILEAKARIGGRAHTDAHSLGLPWDRGAHWLHSADRNPFERYAHACGARYDRGPTPIRLWSDGWAEPALESEFDAYEEHAFAAVQAAGAEGLDLASADVVPPHPRFRAMFDAWFATFVGVEPERMSTLDYARYDDSGHDWRVVDGYGALVVRYGRDLPVRLCTPVEGIRWDGAGVVVTTTDGDLRARSAIVTVSTAVLAEGGIDFQPSLPPARLEAFAAVRPGEANKLAIAFDRDVFGGTAPCYLHFERPSIEIINFEIGPFGRPLAIGHLGGRFAAQVEAAGPEAMVDLAMEHLVEVFGSTIRSRVRAVATTSWCGDPHIGGGYSCARPGCAHLRPLLAEPLADRLWFAGEACSLDAYGTVHGALESGIVAAEAVARHLGGRRVERPWAWP